MDATSTVYQAMVKEIRDSAVTTAQDLSKGVVPIILVIALLAPTWYLRGKLGDLENQLSNNAAATEALGEKIGKLTPLASDVADAKARIDALDRETERLDRDRALTESRLRQLDKDLTERTQRLEIQQ